MPRDVKKGIEWLEKAADQGNVGAEYDLGVIHYNGRDVPQDFKKAFALFAKTADQGNQDGKYNMGVMYMSGQGVDKDYQKAFELFSGAAEGGVKNAQIHLAGMYLFGDGTPKDVVLAYKWAMLADLVDGTLLKGNAAVASASHTGPIRKQMNSDQVDSAKKLVDEWLAKHSLRRDGILTYL